MRASDEVDGDVGLRPIGSLGLRPIDVEDDRADSVYDQKYGKERRLKQKRNEQEVPIITRQGDSPKALSLDLSIVEVVQLGWELDLGPI
ncbi:hypothetical protein SO802_021993 [Lithocarpus litseifolius]|uniref:Uncharacterized protein n=1 Tax=Lithocarpus litseifolius TaxID=425828 RepID=A0AAW2CIS6_9ROSI